jgi:hypothetical protein
VSLQWQLNTWPASLKKKVGKGGRHVSTVMTSNRIHVLQLSYQPADKHPLHRYEYQGKESRTLYDTNLWRMTTVLEGVKLQSPFKRGSLFTRSCEHGRAILTGICSLFGA